MSEGENWREATSLVANTRKEGGNDGYLCSLEMAVPFNPSTKEPIPANLFILAQ